MRGGALAVYVSGHGFGHATRTAEVLRAVRERAPGLPIVVCTTAPTFLFDGVAPPLEMRRVEPDFGLVQKDALAIDEAATAAAWLSFRHDLEGRVAREADWLQASGARLVLGDIPPLAFAAAARAGLDGLALGNFSWDWVYRHLSARQPGLEEAAEWAARAYGGAALLLKLPFAAGLEAFARVIELPLVARRPRREREQARGRLGLDGRPAVLLSFGGVGLPGLDPAVLSGLAEYQLLLTGAALEGSNPANLRRLDGRELEAAGLGYPDLVGAVDVVVTKPGYGIVSDCVAARTRLVYTDRGDFPEYPVLVGALPRFLPAAYVASADVRRGRLREALEAVRALPFPEAPRLDGAELAAREIVARLGGGG
jgi:hypothetical protein